LLGKLSAPKEDKSLDELPDVGKRMSRFINLNEVGHTELICGEIGHKAFQCKKKSNNNNGNNGNTTEQNYCSYYC
jgi:hypothetical protein